MTDSRESELLQLIEKRVGVHERRTERLVQEQEWLTRWAYWKGKQDFSIQNGRMWGPDPAQINDFDVNYQVNFVRARTDVAVAKIMGVNASFAARPPGNRAEDRRRSEVSNKVFDHIRAQTDFEKHRLTAQQWAFICGSGILSIRWNPLIGEPERFYFDDGRAKVVVPDAMLTQEQRDSKEQLGLYQDTFPGDLDVAVCSPFGFFQDTAARDKGIPGCHWVAERHFADIDRIAERFNVDPADIHPVEDDGGLTNYEEAIAFMSSGTGYGVMDFVRPEEKRGKRTLYIEMWQRPDSKNKKGLRLCYAGGKLLNAGKTDNPYVFDKSGWAHLPYVKVDHKPSPGQFWGASGVEDMIRPQFYLNKVRSSIIAFVDVHGQPATYVGENSNIDTDSMTSQTGRIYKISENSAVGVKVGPVPQMPAEVLQIMPLLKGDLDSVASQSEIDGGKLPGQLRSGSALKQVNDERFAGLSIPALESVRAMRDAGRIFLAIGQRYYTEPRLLKYQGDDEQWVVESFKGSDLVNDIVVVGDVDISSDANSSSQEMMDMVSAGVFNPQFDKETRVQIASGLNLKSSSEFVAHLLQAKKAAERAIQEMKRDPLKYGDQGYPVLPWQDHETEIGVLVEFMYSPEFMTLDPGTQALITKYWHDHQQMLQQEQLQQLQMVEATKGAAATPGQASQPRAK